MADVSASIYHAGAPSGAPCASCCAVGTCSAAGISVAADVDLKYDGSFRGGRADLSSRDRGPYGTQPVETPTHPHLSQQAVV